MFIRFTTYYLCSFIGAEAGGEARTGVSLFYEVQGISRVYIYI